jgi:hypothetical protein
MRKRASHWGAARQEDAHEFFTALLNGLADEVQQAQVGEVMGKSRQCLGLGWVLSPSHLSAVRPVAAGTQANM